MDVSEHDQVTRAIGDVRTFPWGSEEYSRAHQFLSKILEADLRRWVRSNPPGSADYDESSPRRAVYLYADQLHPDFSVKEISGILLDSSYFEKVVSRALRTTRASSSEDSRKAVGRQFPEYESLLKQVREAKRRWNEEDASIKRSPSFRMMGGLARLGSRSGSEYRRLVERAQSMEKSVLGHELTSFSKPR